MQVKTNMKTRETMQCALNLTANARNGILKFFDSEQAFFASEKSFELYIEKRNENRQGNLSFSIYFDNVQNGNLATLLNERVAVMECVIKNEGFLATGFHVRGKREPVATNRRYGVNLKFVLNRRTAAQMPIELYTALRELPIAEERSEYVKKRIASWEGYLRIQEMNADVEDITTNFTSPRFSEDFSKVQMICSGLQRKDLRKMNGFSANVTGLSGDIGNVIQVNPSQKMIEIELSSRFKNQARRHELNLHRFKEITFNNFAELSQVRRLRKGFKDLQDGLAANSNLERVLFEERPVVRISNKKKELEFHNRLNKFQQEAVTGAMTANDLYVIQGPPGTGKTTVISEICYQNAKAGLRTLVASQANLAVDNALGRLLDDQDIRILRYGRTESIEEEGRKFIEENVAHYWKEQTIEALEQQLQQHKERRQQLEEALIRYEKQLKDAQEKLQVIDEKIKEKECAQIEYNSLQKTVNQVINEKQIVLEQQTAEQTKQQQLETKHQTVLVEIDRLKEAIKQSEMQPEEIALMKENVAELQEVQEVIQYQETFNEEQQLGKELLLVEENQLKRQEHVQQVERFLEESLFILKLVEFQTCLTTYQIDLSNETHSKIAQLEQLILKIKESLSNNTSDVWHTLEARIQKAIDTVENILKQQGFSSQTVQRNLPRRVMSSNELHGFLDRLGQFLIQPQTKQLLSTRHYSAERYDALERFASSYNILKQQRDFIRMHYTNIDERQRMENLAKQLFKDIKKESIEAANQSVNELTKHLENDAGKIKELQLEQADVQERLATLQIPKGHEEYSLATLKEKFEKLQSFDVVYKEKQQTIQEYTQTLAKNEKECTQLLEKIEQNRAILKEQKLTIEKLTEVLHDNEKEQQVLQGKIQSKPEEEQKVVNEQIAKYDEQIARYQAEKEQLPMKEMLQTEWLTMLENATEYDLEEIKKLYIEHANVIGTTCVASARRDFMEDYPTFDVVIIDEVSKATPPELLLPMLKGKKIILVGDHHQLPPLIGQETMEEFLEESSSAAEKKELEQLLKESLFERLFRTLPKQNKTMLAIQYRMHEKIMDTITPFYDEDDYLLQCGLENSDLERNHLLESRDFNENHHLLWFDIPNEKPYFEARVKGGTSRYNEAELSKIRSLLNDLNEATGRAITQGKLQAGEKKNIGVISFYGEQVKRIDRLIEHDLHLPNLHCRTGSVDKFQGMEMDVIILSFVRNHDHPRGDIGFAQDYRRLNVALSRARELLMIVGSADMFTKRPKNKNTREMFTHLLEKVKEQDGWHKLFSEEK